MIWATSFDTFDAWGLYTVQATAQANSVTVFTRSTPLYGSQHNDIYLDDASLVAVGAGTTSVTSGQPSAPAIPMFTYTVRRGDNYFRIARRFDLTVDALYKANHIGTTNRNLLKVGTVLIIPGATVNT